MYRSHDQIEFLQDSLVNVQVAVRSNFDFGASQVIWRFPEGGAYLGASESRRDGAAVGF